MAAILKSPLSDSFSGLKQWINIGLDNGLAPSRWQARIWTDDGLAYWLIHASLGLSEINN